MLTITECYFTKQKILFQGSRQPILSFSESSYPIIHLFFKGYLAFTPKNGETLGTVIPINARHLFHRVDIKQQ